MISTSARSPFPLFLLTPLREGRPGVSKDLIRYDQFLLTPLREGRRRPQPEQEIGSRISTHAPAGGATSRWRPSAAAAVFLLTPLREGRLHRNTHLPADRDFYSRPCGRGDLFYCIHGVPPNLFLLTPLREGRRAPTAPVSRPASHFYSRPCGRGDLADVEILADEVSHFYSRPCGRGDAAIKNRNIGYDMISTHAPAGGATLWLQSAPLG